MEPKTETCGHLVAKKLTPPHVPTACRMPHNTPRAKRSAAHQLQRRICLGRISAASGRAKARTQAGVPHVRSKLLKIGKNLLLHQEKSGNNPGTQNGLHAAWSVWIHSHAPQEGAREEVLSENQRNLPGIPKAKGQGPCCLTDHKAYSPTKWKLSCLMARRYRLCRRPLCIPC